jgi:tetratricopeptide (TPR) repeat protein
LVVSLEDDVASVDLGSLDGVRKGSELTVFRDERSTDPIGRVIVSAVFRERARGRILAGQGIQIHNSVRVQAVDYLNALLQQATAMSGRGDPGSARTMAERAVRWADSAKVAPDEKGKALQLLAALEYQAGSPQAAEKHYKAAVESFRASAASLLEIGALNALGVLYMLRGDYDSAATLLSQVVSKSPATAADYASGTNNLGVLAEFRGDRRRAEQLYTSALHALASVREPSQEERRVVEANLARLADAR